LKETRFTASRKILQIEFDIDGSFTVIIKLRYPLCGGHLLFLGKKKRLSNFPSASADLYLSFVADVVDVPSSSLNR
jgi:hypothetical protein